VAFSARCAIADVKQLSERSVIGWVIKNLLSRSSVLRKTVMSVVSAVFQAISTHHWAGVVGYSYIPYKYVSHL
jgi:hypothetical protein